MKMSIVYILLLVLLSLNAQAVERTIGWAPPSEREDESALLPEEIAKYKLICWQGKERCGIFNPQGGLTNKQTIDMPPGIYTFYMRTIDTEGRESDLSAPVTINFTTPVVSKADPMPPTGIVEQ